MHLIASTGEECQELFKWVKAKNALDVERLEIAFQAEGHNLILSILDANSGGC